jgi:hypothetical protein
MKAVLQALCGLVGHPKDVLSRTPGNYSRAWLPTRHERCRRCGWEGVFYDSGPLSRFADESGVDNT